MSIRDKAFFTSEIEDKSLQKVLGIDQFLLLLDLGVLVVFHGRISITLNSSCPNSVSRASRV